MSGSTAPRPIVDLHCDLLHYLTAVDGADPLSTDDIGCAIPHLLAGHVKLQVCAVYVPTQPGSVADAERQMARFRQLPAEHEVLRTVTTADEVSRCGEWEETAVVLAVENASALAEEDESLQAAIDRLARLVRGDSRLLYVSLTHMGDNRYGGAAGSSTGLRDDGRALLEQLDGTGVAVDLSHASDQLITDVLAYCASGNRSIPVIASHSNLRAVWSHARNLPDWAAREIIDREGLIGLNLLREYLHPNDPESLARHVEHGLGLGGEQALCFGADYFCTRAHPDASRAPFFFASHEHAGCYQPILRSLEGVMSGQQLDGLAWRNALRYLQRSW